MSPDRCGYYSTGEALALQAKWATESGLPSRRLRAMVDHVRAHQHLTEDQLIMVRAQELFRELEAKRIRQVPGSFNQAQFNQWWALLWVLGPKSSHIQLEEDHRLQEEREEKTARGPPPAGPVQAYPDGPSRRLHKGEESTHQKEEIKGGSK